MLRLTISNPAKRNALDHPLLDAISADARRARGAGLAGALRDRDRARTGCSRRATTSANRIPDEDFEERAERLVAHPFTLAIEALEAFPYPTLAALPGHTIGGGLELALSCDLRVAQSGVKLGMPPAKLGLVYSHTGLRRFIDAIGAPRTRELFLLGATSTRRLRSRGAWSTAWPRPRSSRRWRSSWQTSWPATRRCRRPATSA